MRDKFLLVFFFVSAIIIFFVATTDPHSELTTMSTAFLTVVAVIMCILFRILNVNSEALKPALWCVDTTFLDCIYKIAPLLRDP